MYSSSYKTIAAVLVSALEREGVAVGNTASYPRIELHTFIEAPAMDKGNAVRVLSCIVESMSNRSAGLAADMNAENLSRLGALAYSGEDFAIVGIVPTQLQELTETSDPQLILYRVLQSIDIYIQQL